MEGVALDWQDAWYTDLETAYVYLDELERLGKGLRWVMYADGYVRPRTGDVRTTRDDWQIAAGSVNLLTCLNG